MVFVRFERLLEKCFLGERGVSLVMLQTTGLRFHWNETPQWVFFEDFFDASFMTFLFEKIVETTSYVEHICHRYFVVVFKSL